MNEAFTSSPEDVRCLLKLQDILNVDEQTALGIAVGIRTNVQKGNDVTSIGWLSDFSRDQVVRLCEYVGKTRDYWCGSPAVQ